jgi:hypothetical protein
MELPVCSKNKQERKKYEISFEPISSEDFEEFECSSFDNWKLTKNYLFFLLLEKVKRSGKFNDDEFICSQPQKSFRKRIWFVLQTHNEGKETVWLEPYYLEISREFGFLVDFEFRKEESIKYSKEIQRLSLSLDKNYRSNRNFYIDKYEKLKVFVKQFGARLSPLKEENYLEIQWELLGLPYKELKPKTYIFAGNRTNVSQFKGLEEHGPYKKIPRNNILLRIFHKNGERYLAEDLKKCLEGNSEFIAYFSGFKQMFRADDLKITLQSVSELSFDEIKKSLEKGELPILILSRKDEKTYFDLKFELLNENIPSQFVTSELLRSKDGLKWAISNIALQIFAKLGGAPWIVKDPWGEYSSFEKSKSIIIGIGQAHDISEGKIKKFFTYFVSTTSNGLYEKAGILGHSTEEYSYLQQIGERISELLKNYVAQHYSRVVIHVPFKIKKREIERILHSIQNIKQDNVELTVLKINTKNKFFGYAYTNSMVPYESSYIKLSNQPASFLIWFEGIPKQQPKISKRISGPVHIEFRWSNKQNEITQHTLYLQEILNLSGANWRGFNAKSLPVSIYYCKLIAKFLKHFPRAVENIGQIKNPWFL